MGVAIAFLAVNPYHNKNARPFVLCPGYKNIENPTDCDYPNNF